MTATRTRTRFGGPRKSPLRLAAEPAPVIDRRPCAVPPDAGSLASCSPEELRQLMISEFGQWLRSRTNKHKRPFQEDTISAYRDAVVALSGWMTREGIQADFTGHAARVRQITGQGGYTTRQSAYDLRKLRGKQLVDKPGRTRSYHLPPHAARTISALLTLRDQVIAPILAGVRSPAWDASPEPGPPSIVTTRPCA
jgi:hypothetical protein